MGQKRHRLKFVGLSAEYLRYRFCFIYQYNKRLTEEGEDYETQWKQLQTIAAIVALISSAPSAFASKDLQRSIASETYKGVNFEITGGDKLDQDGEEKVLKENS